MDFATGVTYVLHNIPGFGMLVTFQMIDVISGCAVAAGRGKWNSSIGRKGLARKVGMVCLFGCAVAIEHWVPGAPPMSGVAALFLSWGEIQSIIENADDLGIPLPPSVVKWMRERRKLTEKQIDKVLKGGLTVELMEVKQAESVVVKNKTNPEADTIHE